MSAALSRRDFLAYGGATIAGVTLGEAGRRWLARADAREGAWRAQAVESWQTSVCRECPAACGIRVRLMDQTPVKLEGNPLCPVGRGRLCAKGQAALESYFDPDRLVGPARRKGRRGEGQWERLSWTDAIDLVSTRIARARTDKAAILALAAEEHGPIAEAWSRFWSSLGARVAWTPASTAARLAPRLSTLAGTRNNPSFDLDRATHVLSFGAPIVEDWLSPVWAQRSYGRFRRGGSRPRGRLTHIDDRRSLTARKADEWLPVAADRQAFLAYGIASVLLRENRVDRAFLAQAGGNVDEFERDVVARFTPDDVAVATGVPVVTLLRLARELSATAQPLVVVAADAPTDLVDAVLALNALVGAFDRTGGLFESATGANGVELNTAIAALGNIEEERARPGLVAFKDASALRSISTPEGAVAALERCDFIVSFSPYLDETAAVADLLLPTHTSLESWHALQPSTADPTEKIACARPAAARRLDTADLVSILHRAGRKLGGDASTASAASSSAEIVDAELGRLWNLRRGVPYSETFESDWVAQLEKGGWWVAPANTREAFADATLTTGGWVDPFVPAGSIRAAIARKGGLTFVPPAALGRPVAAADPPHAEIVRASLDLGAPAGPAPEFPLRLVAFTPAAVNLVGGPNQPVLFELLGQPESAPWRVWAEMNPETARASGISHGEEARITSAAGSVEALAIVVEGAPADTVAVAYVPALAGGRWARLVDADLRRVIGRASGHGVAVRLTKV